jgi:MFS family permease
VTAAPARPAWPGLAVVGLGASLVPLDFAVNVAFPAITDAFALPTLAIRWAAVCYVLTYGSLMIGFGALGDRIGYLRVFRAGLAIAAIAFAACALAPSYPWFLAARVLQGVGVSLVVACAPAIATLLVDESRRTWALAGYGAAQALAGVAAPLAGGAFLALMDWPGVYWFRVPIALAALAGVPWLARVADRQVRRTDTTFDASGSALLAAAVALLLLAPALLGPALEPWPAVPVALAGAVAMAVFVRRQRASTAPFLPAAVARDAGFRSLNAAACLVHLAGFSVALVVPYYLLRGGGGSPIGSGMVLGVWALGALAGSAIAARAVGALGARRAAAWAAALSAAGLAAIAAWPDVPHAGAMAASLAVQGTGLGLFQVAYTDAVVAALPIASRGVAGSLTMVTRTVGIVLGATLWLSIVQVFERAAGGPGASGGEARAALMAAVAVVYATAAAAAAAGAAWIALGGRGGR